MRHPLDRIFTLGILQGSSSFKNIRCNWEGMRRYLMYRFRSLFSFVLLGCLVTLVLVAPALAQTAGDVTKVQSFMQNVIQILVTLAGLLAAGFLVMGGIGYITSSGNPEHLDRSKRTIIYASLGLAICIGAFVLTNVVSQIATTSFGK